MGTWDEDALVSLRRIAASTEETARQLARLGGTGFEINAPGQEVEVPVPVPEERRIPRTLRLHLVEDDQLTQALVIAAPDGTTLKSLLAPLGIELEVPDTTRVPRSSNAAWTPGYCHTVASQAVDLSQSDPEVWDVVILLAPRFALKNSSAAWLGYMVDIPQFDVDGVPRTIAVIDHGTLLAASKDSLPGSSTPIGWELACFRTLCHELGHALNLAHEEYNGIAGTPEADGDHLMTSLRNHLDGNDPAALRLDFHKRDRIFLAEADEEWVRPGGRPFMAHLGGGIDYGVKAYELDGFQPASGLALLFGAGEAAAGLPPRIAPGEPLDLAVEITATNEREVLAPLREAVRIDVLDGGRVLFSTRPRGHGDLGPSPRDGTRPARGRQEGLRQLRRGAKIRTRIRLQIDVDPDRPDTVHERPYTIIDTGTDGRRALTVRVAYRGRAGQSEEVVMEHEVIIDRSLSPTIKLPDSIPQLPGLAPLHQPWAVATVVSGGSAALLPAGLIESLLSQDNDALFDGAHDRWLGLLMDELDTAIEGVLRDPERREDAARQRRAWLRRQALLNIRSDRRDGDPSPVGDDPPDEPGGPTSPRDPLPEPPDDDPEDPGPAAA